MDNVIFVPRKFLSTLSLRRATRRSVKLFRQNYVSIHALLAESDERADSFPHTPPQVSIHALLAESDPINNGITLQHTQFLSTLSLRRATGLGWEV